MAFTRLTAGMTALAVAFPSVAVAQSPDASALYEQLLTLGDKADFPRPSGPWQLDLPADLGAHPNARSETWLIAAHLETPEGRPVALQVSFARLGLRTVSEGPFDPAALYRAHIVAASPNDPLEAEERLSRGLGAAGTEGARIWLDSWTMTLGRPGISLQSPAAGLDFAPIMDPIQQDPAGNSPVRGYTAPRVAVSGRVGGTEVTGTAWIDHLWGDVPPPGGPLAYDRLIVHLDDGSAVSLLRTRRRDGAGIATLDGALIDDAGTTPLNDDTAEMTATESWTPDDGAGSYPVAWQLAGAGLVLDIAPFRRDQLTDFAFPLWSGGVTVTGTRDGQPVTGTGTLTLSGYGA